jgi:hypothetical protein
MKKLAVGSLAAIAILIGAAGRAFAHDCGNFSRPPSSATDPQPTGRWIYLTEAQTGVPGGLWAFDNPAGFGGQSGHDQVLLDGTGACSEARLIAQTKGVLDPSLLKGIWSGDCLDSLTS